MKKLLLTIAIAASGLMTAQEATSEVTSLEGAWWAMGTLNYSNVEATDVSSFKLLPIVGTFVSPTVTVGAGVGFQSVTVGDADAVNSFVVMPLVRKYWGVADQLYVFGQAAVPMTFSDGSNTIGFQLSPGIDYFLSDHFSIEASLGVVDYTTFNPEEGESSGDINIGLDTTDLNFGLKYIF